MIHEWMPDSDRKLMLNLDNLGRILIWGCVVVHDITQVLRRCTNDIELIRLLNPILLPHHAEYI